METATGKTLTLPDAAGIPFSAWAYAILVKSKIEVSAKRKLILDELGSYSECFNRDSVYVNIRNKNIKLSKSTVDKMINLLLQSGLIVTVVESSKEQHYRLAGPGEVTTKENS